MSNFEKIFHNFFKKKKKKRKEIHNHYINNCQCAIFIFLNSEVKKNYKWKKLQIK